MSIFHPIILTLAIHSYNLTEMISKVNVESNKKLIQEKQYKIWKRTKTFQFRIKIEDIVSVVMVGWNNFNYEYFLVINLLHSP